jgi:hypothetical protein
VIADNSHYWFKSSDMYIARIWSILLIFVAVLPFIAGFFAGMMETGNWVISILLGIMAEGTIIAFGYAGIGAAENMKR